MQQARWLQIETIYHAALETSGAAERRAYLDAACAGDAELRREVDSLLRESEAEDDFLEEPALTLGMALLAREQEDAVAGHRLGPYRLVRTLGAGGMGEVYLADDPRLGRRVAVKLLPPHLTADAESVRRFRQEARAASKISHPHVAHIYETDQVDDRHYLAMEYVEGRTLREVLGGGGGGEDAGGRAHHHHHHHSLDHLLALDFALQIAQALDGAHREGVVHRDIKPENVMVRPDGFLKVLDFGVAKLSDEAAGDDVSCAALSQATTPGVVVGTTAYMSPEQIRGQAVDARTDLWSLGVVFYEMLEGRQPFTGETPADTSAAILTKEPPACLRADGETKSILLRALRKKTGERYQTAAELVEDLKRVKRDAEFDRHRSGATAAAVVVTTTREGAAFAETGEVLGTVPGEERDQQSPAAAAASLSTSPGSRAGGARDDLPTSGGWWWSRRSATSKTILAAATIASLTFALGGAAHYISGDAPPQEDESSAAAMSPTEKFSSLAVLPFVNESGDARLDFLSQGLAEDLIRNLGRDRSLRVIALSSARKIAEASAPEEIGRKLGVGALLRGKIGRGEGGQLFIAPEIIDARSGALLWRDKFAASPDDLLLLRNTMTVIMFTQLQGVLGRDKRIVVSEYPTSSAAAYGAYLAGRYAPDRYDVSGLGRAIRSLERAVELDPRYSLAQIALADAYNLMGTFLGQRPEYYQPKAKKTLERAMALDPSLAEGHTLLAKILMDYDRDWEGAEHAFKRAIELNPGYARAHHLYGEVYLSAMGRLDESVRELETARALDPLATGIITGLAWSYTGKREYARAVALCDEARAIDPSDWSIYSYRAMALLKLGRFDEAVADARSAYEHDRTGANLAMLGALSAYAGRRAEAENILMQLRTDRRFADAPKYHLAIVHAALGQRDEAFRLLRVETEVRESVALLSIRIDPMLDELRSDPRFRELEQSFNFPAP